MNATKKLSEIATIQTGHSFRGKIVHVDGGALGVVQANDIRGIHVEESSIPRLEQEHSTTRLLHSGDILLTARGSFRAAVSTFSKPAVAASSLFTIRLDTVDFLPGYIAIYLNSEAAQYHFRQCAVGATIQSILINDLRALSIPHIDIEAQQAIINLQHNIEAQNQLLRRRQQIIDNILRTSVTKTLEGATT